MVFHLSCHYGEMAIRYNAALTFRRSWANLVPGGAADGAIRVIRHYGASHVSIL